MDNGKGILERFPTLIEWRDQSPFFFSFFLFFLFLSVFSSYLLLSLRLLASCEGSHLASQNDTERRTSDNCQTWPEGPLRLIIMRAHRLIQDLRSLQHSLSLTSGNHFSLSSRCLMKTMSPRPGMYRRPWPGPRPEAEPSRRKDVRSKRWATRQKTASCLPPSEWRSDWHNLLPLVHLALEVATPLPSSIQHYHSRGHY